MLFFYFYQNHSVDSRAVGVRGNSFTYFSQEGGITIGENRDHETITSNPNLGNTRNENAIINVHSDEQPINISRDQ
jgi:hypothetical protein